MKAFESEDGYIILRLDTGDDILKSVQEVCRAESVNTGAVISGIGTINRLKIHYLHSDNLNKPQGERNTVIQSEDCWEISGISGVIASGKPHIHMTIFNGNKTVAGHLEEGCIINALGEIVIRRVDGLSLTRSSNEFGVNVLQSNE